MHMAPAHCQLCHHGQHLQLLEQKSMEKVLVDAKPDQDATGHSNNSISNHIKTFQYNSYGSKTVKCTNRDSHTREEHTTWHT